MRTNVAYSTSLQAEAMASDGKFLVNPVIQAECTHGGRVR